MTKELKQLIEDKAMEMWPDNSYTVLTCHYGRYIPVLQPDTNKENRDKAMQLAEAVAGMMWVSVDDRLPEIDKRVITFAERGNVGRMEVVFWTDSEERDGLKINNLTKKQILCR